MHSYVDAPIIIAVPGNVFLPVVPGIIISGGDYLKQYGLNVPIVVPCVVKESIVPVASEVANPVSQT